MFENRFYSVAEVARALGVSKVAVYVWRRQGKFPHGVLLGASRRFDGRELNAWLETRYEADARG